MDIKQLSIFLAVANHGSFTEAAVSLFMSQPTISVQIAALERELGVTLFERKSHGVTLTPAGQVLKPYAADILAMRDRAAEAIDHYKSDFSGTLTLLASSVPAGYVIPKLVAEFLAEYPKVFIQLRHADSQEVWDRILNYDADLGIVGSIGNEASIESFPIIEDEVILIAPPKSKYAAWGDIIDIESLLAEPIVCREPGSGTQVTFDKALQEHGIDPRGLNIRARLESAEAIKAAVAADAGLGLGIVSARAAAAEIAERKLKAVRIKGIDLHRQLYMINHKRKVLSPTALAFRDFVLERLLHPRESTADELEMTRKRHIMQKERDYS